MSILNEINIYIHIYIQGVHEVPTYLTYYHVVHKSKLRVTPCIYNYSSIKYGAVTIM